MPRIIQYNNEVKLSGQPYEGAAFSQERLGRAAQAAIDQGGNAIKRGINVVEQHYAQQEMSQAGKDYAEAFATYTNDWNETAKAADPNDQHVAAEWREKKLESFLSDFEQGADTRQGQEARIRYADELRKHFFEKTTADVSNMAADAAVGNINTSTDQFSNAVRADPTAYDHIKGQYPTMIGDQVNAHPNLTAEAATKIHKEVSKAGMKQIAQSAALGMIDKNAAEAKTTIAGGKFDDALDGTDTQRLLNIADEKIKANHADERAAEADARRKETLAARTAAGQVYDKMLSQPLGQDGRLQPYPGMANDILKIPDDESGIKGTMLHWVEHVNKPIVVRSDPVTKGDLTDRIFRPQSDPTHVTDEELTRAHEAGALTDPDFLKLHGLMTKLANTKDPAQKQEMQFFTQQLNSRRLFITQSNPIIGRTDPLGDQKWGDFKADMQEMYLNERAAGKPRNQIMEEIDKLIPSYQPYHSTADALQSVTEGVFGPPQPRGTGPQVPYRGANSVAPGAIFQQFGTTQHEAPKWQQGESAEDFLKRTQ